MKLLDFIEKLQPEDSIIRASHIPNHYIICGCISKEEIVQTAYLYKEFNEICFKVGNPDAFEKFEINLTRVTFGYFKQGFFGTQIPKSFDFITISKNNDQKVIDRWFQYHHVDCSNDYDCVDRHIILEGIRNDETDWSIFNTNIL